ncbi:hypothetical protein E2C01_055502 [Portunus trituberculatus]|uniref:Uncharacterized protein n=1 Tax=Portunus trituberculatus TaxID=210409 RepID=A0A5B7GMM2_PORTR|nr:hypothetical protein [Portunus trituberculatus]
MLTGVTKSAIALTFSGITLYPVGGLDESTELRYKCNKDKLSVMFDLYLIEVAPLQREGSTAQLLALESEVELLS